MSLGQWNAVRKAAERNAARLKAGGIPEACARAKTRKNWRKCEGGRSVGEVFESVLGLVRPGVRESELAAELGVPDAQARASGPSFETIVASGKRSALPHARPTAKKLRKK